MRGLFAPAGYLRAAHFLVGGGGRGQGGKRAWPQPQPQQLEACKILAHHPVQVHVLGPKRFNQGHRCPGVHVKSILLSVFI